jgi:cytochrome b6-f complex iron-sulfur subunit
METKSEQLGCEITRRHALKVLVQGGFVLVATAIGSGESEAATWEKVGSVAQFKTGVPRRITLPKGQVVLVTRQDSTHWLALSARCTHEGGEVRWNATQKRFVCPLHGASFAATGKDPRGAARTPLASFPAQVKGTAVQLDTSRASVSATPTKGKGHEDDDDEHEGEREHEGKKWHKRDDN